MVATRPGCSANNSSKGLACGSLMNSPGCVDVEVVLVGHNVPHVLLCIRMSSSVCGLTLLL